MNELRVFNFNNVDVVDSREVAKMVERNHKELLRDIHRYIEIMEKSTEPKIGPNERNFAPVDFFIPSTYQDGKGETRPCYLLTKKGCDMVANKMTGEKGVLFTAAYVTAFEKMRERINASVSLEVLNKTMTVLDKTATALDALTSRVEALERTSSTVVYAQDPPNVSLTGLAKVIAVTRRVMLDMGSSPEAVGRVTREIMKTCGFRLPHFKDAGFLTLKMADFF